MGLLDGLLGAAMGGNAAGGSGIQGALLQALIKQVMGGGTQQAGGGMGGMLGNVVGSMLGGNQAAGGADAGGLAGLLGGLLGGPQGGQQAAGGLSSITDLLSKAGLGEQVQSWVGTGENAPVSAEQLQTALNQNGVLGQLAQDAGVSEQEAAGGLAEMLPNLVNTLTPNGKIDATDIGAVLSNLIK